MIPLRYPLGAAIAALLIAFLVLLAIRSWRTRASAQSQLISAPLNSLDSVGFLATGFYVATTMTAEPLNRITAYRLGARGRADFSVGATGLLIERVGEPSLAIPTAQLVDAQTATATIDRAVEAEGLIEVLWHQNSVKLSTFIRVVDRQARKQLLEQIQALTQKEASK